MNHKSTLAFALTKLATLIVAASVVLTAGSVQAAAAHKNPASENGHHPPSGHSNWGHDLSPGKYRVKITPAPDESGDPTVQFSILHNPYGDDFNPPYEEVVVLTKASMVDLRAPAVSTELIPSSGDDHKAS
jgi:hypothetical protein